MCQKIISDNLCDPTVFQLQNKEILILGDNDFNGKDIQRIESLFHSAFDRFGDRPVLTVEDIESRYKLSGVEALFSYFKSYQGVDNCLFFFNTNKDKVVEESQKKHFKHEGHLCGFIKKGESCAWFDPNFGEVAFTHYDDFLTWFGAEATRGVLKKYKLMHSREAITFSVVRKGKELQLKYSADPFSKDRRYYRIELVPSIALVSGGIETFRQEYALNPIPFVAE